MWKQFVRTSQWPHPTLPLLNLFLASPLPLGNSILPQDDAHLLLQTSTCFIFSWPSSYFHFIISLSSILSLNSLHLSSSLYISLHQKWKVNDIPLLIFHWQLFKKGHASNRYHLIPFYGLPWTSSPFIFFYYVSWSTYLPSLQECFQVQGKCHSLIKGDTLYQKCPQSNKSSN